MATKNVQDCTMSALVMDVRNQAASLVRDAENHTQSRMLAYERVGQSVGVSGMWVRGFVKGYERYSLSHVVAMNIRALYERTCKHIETENEKIRAEDAAPKSNSGMREITDSATLLPPNDY